MHKFAISDIHGNVKTFRRLVERQLKLGLEDELYLLGDYVDRGPSSKEVIDYIWELQKKGYAVHCLKGNHEEMMLEAAAQGKEDEYYWKVSGGLHTLKSFEVDKIIDVPKIYLEFLASLPYYVEVDNYILVHAGLNFEQENPLKIHEDMLWRRDWYDEINYIWLGQRTIIHGHTPISQRQIKHLYENLDLIQYLNIDCGSFMRLDPDKGRLCAFEMTQRQLFFQENID